MDWTDLSIVFPATEGSPTGPEGKRSSTASAAPLTVQLRPRMVPMMRTHVETFRVSMGTQESVDACNRALRLLEWNEQSSDRLTIRLLDDLEDDGSVIVGLLHKYVPIARPVIDRYTIRSVRAPDGPPRADAEIIAVLGRRMIVRISLREQDAFGTDTTISGSDLGVLPWTGPLRSAIGTLRRSIEIQSGGSVRASS